jgi:hypothetical protein
MLGDDSLWLFAFRSWRFPFEAARLSRVLLDALRSGECLGVVSCAMGATPFWFLLWLMVIGAAA